MPTDEHQVNMGDENSAMNRLVNALDGLCLEKVVLESEHDVCGETWESEGTKG